jgi:peptide/nickel transport system substrate-binding protein
VVTFSRPYAGWKSLFGAFYGVLPSHLLTGQDRAAAMTNGYDWSGGPWLADWTRGVQVELTPNPNWYGKRPRLDRVIFRFQDGTAAEFAALRRGEVLAIYPEAQPEAVRATRRGLGNVNTIYTADTGNIEAIWINNERPPFDSEAVRQALAYAVGRDAIVRRLFAPLDVTRAVNTINPPIQDAYSDPEAWSRYRRDLGEVTRLMEGDGWTKNADEVWEKDGQAAVVTITTTSGNPRRQVITRMLREQLRSAGFELTVDTVPAAELFDTILPAGNYQLSLYTQIATSLQPALCTIFCTANIPSAANDFRGQNYGRVSTAADDPLTQVTTNLDVAAGQAAGKQADQILAEEQVALPLDPLPNLLLWSRRIVGPVRDDPILGMFANIDQWGLARRTDS